MASGVLKLAMNLQMVQILTARKFDNKLANLGISLNDLMILHHLGEAPDERLRRSDLAEKIGLTASGITRMLVPLERTGLVRREANSRDARVSYVKLAPAGKRVLTDGIREADALAEQIFGVVKGRKADEFMKLLIDLGGSVV